MAKRRGSKLGIGCAALIVLIAAGIAFTEPGRAIQDLWSRGILQELVKGTELRKYEASREANLKMLGTTLESYHKSEDAYPPAATWMDAISDRLKVNDLTTEEAAKKLVRPDLAAKADAYGYSLNKAAAGKYRGDLKPNTILFFESKGLTRNLAGDPKADGLRGGLGWTVEGKIVKL